MSASLYGPVTGRRVTTTDLAAAKERSEKWPMITAYDASLAGVCDRAGIDILLVGDSLGMVVQGRPTTVPVDLADMLYHTRCVVAGSSRALVITDLPFGSYQAGPEDAFRAGAAALKAGAQMVKLEGGATMVETTRFLVERGIGVCAHIGLTPQSVNTLGGYRVQGKSEEAADRIIGYLDSARGLSRP